MPLATKLPLASHPRQTNPQPVLLRLDQLDVSAFSTSIYGHSINDVADLLHSIRDQGILVPLAIAPGISPNRWELLSGHRRLACAKLLDLPSIPCLIHHLDPGPARCQAILDYNKHRRKTFSQLMREADALEDLSKDQAQKRRLANLRNTAPAPKNGPRLSSVGIPTLEPTIPF